MEYNFVIITWGLVFIALALWQLIGLYIKSKRCSVCVKAKILDVSLDSYVDLHDGVLRKFYTSACEFNYNNQVYQVKSSFGRKLNVGDYDDIYINPNNPEEIITKFIKTKTITIAIVFAVFSLLPLVIFKVCGK